MRRPASIVALGCVLVLAYAASSLRRLDEPDRLYVAESAILHIPPRQIPPGRRFVPRFLTRVSSYPASPVRLRVDLRGEQAAASREGSRLEVEVDLLYALSRERLVDLHRTRGPGYEAWLSDLVRRETAKRLQEASYDAVRDRDPELARSVRSGVEAGAAREGLRISSLRIDQLASGGAGAAAILRVDSRPLEREVVVIGADSFDWRIVDPLVKQGRMPNMARLVARGARANLRTLRPTLSPVIWTSVATGVRPSRHGIVDFVVAAPGTGALLPVTSAMRRAPALWSLLSRQGVPVEVVGWWATWPAETVLGRLVTDRVAYQLFEESIKEDWKNPDPGRNRGKTFPPELIEEVRPLIKSPAEVTDEEVAWFLPGRAIPRSLPADDRALLNSFRTVIASGETYHAIALHLFDREKARAKGGAPRLEMVYYEGPDTTSHLFMRYRPPLLPGVERREMELFGGIVDRYYERQDRLIGEVLDRTGPDATIILLSDHGFKSGDNRPPHSDPRIGGGDAADWHTGVGVLVLAGPGIRPGVDLGTASVLDIAPTVLALFGLPVPRDMDGRPLEEALSADEIGAHPPTWIDTYGGYRQADQEIRNTATAEESEIVEKLRSLGYIGTDRLTAHNNRGLIALDEGDVDTAIADFERALATGGDAGAMIRANLATAWLRKGDLDRAWSFAREALSVQPRCKQAEVILAGVATKKGDPAAAEQHLRQAIAIDPTYVQARSQLGRLLAQRGEDQAALAEYQTVIRIAPLSPVEYNAIGNIYRGRGQIDRAIEAYRDALRCDPQYIGAYNNLGLCLQQRGRLRDASELYEKALLIRPENAILRNSLGTLLSIQGDKEGALSQFERAARSDPFWAVPQGNLAKLLYDGERFPEAKLAFEHWVRLEPDSTETRLEYALCLLKVQEWENAAAQLREILNRDPRDLRARMALGETLVRTGDLEKAQAELEAATRLAGNLPRVYNSLADVYSRRGLKHEARRAYGKSLKIDPGQKEVRRRVAELDR